MRLDLAAWVKGDQRSLLGRSYRAGVLLFGILGFVGAWFFATVAGGFAGFMMGWIPSLIVCVLVGFSWPVLALVATGMLFFFLGWPAIQTFNRPSSPIVTAQAATSSDFSSALSLLCSEMATPSNEGLLSAPPSMLSLLRPELSAADTELVRSSVLAGARYRVLLNRLRSVCGLSELLPQSSNVPSTSEQNRFRKYATEQPASGQPPSPSAGAQSVPGVSYEEAIEEAHKRGLLPPKMKEVYEDAVARGLLGRQPSVANREPPDPRKELERLRVLKTLKDLGQTERGPVPAAP